MPCSFRLRGSRLWRRVLLRQRLTAVPGKGISALLQEAQQRPDLPFRVVPASLIAGVSRSAEAVLRYTRRPTPDPRRRDCGCGLRAPHRSIRALASSCRQSPAAPSPFTSTRIVAEQLGKWRAILIYKYLYLLILSAAGFGRAGHDYVRCISGRVTDPSGAVVEGARTW